MRLKMSQTQALNILEIKQNVSASSADEMIAGSYSHAGDDECPVCKKKMKNARIGQEPIYFCPDHRISFPQKEN
jgi:formamidopyrimidine-DNA glycosylase